ncbi:hypothetical protein FKR81_05385 [Lentzea tibetensis]|uniref:Uncharacterized protein n=1 Tax=Lentzea tibetensis TaxID=2591470 RepID=A0A563F094_9PSEU|nr:hypothetical protein [Lentzea tibetensis]TWP53396.1 hypothetical protein FKR81_05385 [Lentzea tibetensis]
MNTTIPTPRDLPPGRHTEIRAELLRATTRKRFRFAPALTAATALAVIALIAYFVPWRPQAAPPAEHTTIPTTIPTTTRPAEPVIPGLPPEQHRAIAQGCLDSAGVTGSPRLYNYVTTDDTKHGLVFGGDSAHICTVDGPMYDFNADLHSGLDLKFIAGSFALDSTSGSAGGDASYANPARKGKRGSIVTAGRITAEVARVTMTVDGTTVDAVLANDTFLARVLYPSTWTIPENMPAAVVRAYDAGGTLLGSSDTPDTRCYTTPDGAIMTHHQNQPDPATCLPAKLWR